LINIAISKLDKLAILVPRIKLIEGAKIAIKNGGDFREMQKYISNWA
jgi:hypothetical protein